MQESQTAQSNTGLIYGLNDRPCTRGHFCCHTAFAAIFVAIITRLIIAGALNWIWKPPVS